MIKMLLNPCVRGLYAYIVNHVLGIRICRRPLIDLGKPVYSLIGEAKSFNTLFHIAKPGMVFLDVGAGV